MLRYNQFQTNITETDKKLQPRPPWQGSTLSNRFKRLIAPLAVLAMAWVMGFTPGLHAQSLDDVVTNLLGSTNDDVCVKLESAGARPTGALGAFCSQSGGGDFSTSGGGGSSPQTAPGIVQERLEAARSEQESVSQTSGKAVSELAPGWNLFLSGEYEKLDRDVTNFEDGYDSDVLRFTVGSDYRMSDKATAGMAITYTTHDGDLDAGGDFENQAYSFILFGSYQPNEKMFLQGTAGYGYREYDRTRTVSVVLTDVNPIGPGSARGEYEGSEFSTGLLLGYDHTAGGFTIGPRLGLDWIYTQFDGYTEQGDTGLELVFEDTDETSLQSRLGVAASLAVTTGIGVLLPQVSVDWVHEFANDQRRQGFSFSDDAVGVAFSFQDEAPDRDFFEWAVGVSAVLPNGWLPFAQFRGLTGHDYLDSYAGTVGLRIEL